MPVVYIKPHMAAEVAKMEEELLGETAWKERDILEELKRPHARIFVFEKDNRICGFLHAHIICETANIQNMAVYPEFRRQGIGRALLQALAEELPKGKEAEILLEVRESNIAARAFYQAFGFSQVGVRKGFYLSPAEDGLLLKWKEGAAE